MEQIFKRTFRPAKADGWQRLDVFLGKALEGLISREKIKKAILQGQVSFNGKVCLVPKTRVGEGDVLEVVLPAAGGLPEAEEADLDIVHRDAHLAVINKPAGLTVHPCPSCPSGTLVNRLLTHFPELSGQALGQHQPTGVEETRAAAEHGLLDMGGLERGNPKTPNNPEDSKFQLNSPDFSDYTGSPDPIDELDDDSGLLVSQSGDRPGIVHRLDKDTTGLLLVALTEQCRLKLVSAFAARAVRKEYLALVYGVPEKPEGTIDAPIGRDPEHKTRMKAFGGQGAFDTAQERPAGRVGKGSRGDKGGRQAFSEYRVLYADPTRRFSLLAVRIHTGRTHQVRVHLRHIGHPIVGDSTYFDLRAVQPLFSGQVQNRAELEGFLARVATRPLLHAWRLSFEHPAGPAGTTDTAGSAKADGSAVMSLGKAGLERLYAEAGCARDGGEPFDATAAVMSFCCPPPDDFILAARALSQKMRQVVLTGNAGCGKSSVLERLSRAGVPVWSADRAVAASYEPGGDGWRLIRAAFGERFVPDENSGVDKKALFAAMFSDEAVRREVERLVHPVAGESMRDFFESHDLWRAPEAWSERGRTEQAESGGYGTCALKVSGPQECVTAVAEVPLYFESGHLAAAQAEKPLVVGVHCPREIRVERLKTSRNWPDSMIEKMESWQWPEDKKMRACDLVLDNSGSLEDLNGAVEGLLERLTELDRQRLTGIESELRRLMSCE